MGRQEFTELSNCRQCAPGGYSDGERIDQSKWVAVDAAEVTWLLDCAQQIDPDAWKPSYPGRMAKRRLDAVRKAKDELDAKSV